MRKEQSIGCFDVFFAKNPEKRRIRKSACEYIMKKQAGIFLEQHLGIDGRKGHEKQERQICRQKKI